jgi:beta-glucosidase
MEEATKKAEEVLAQLSLKEKVALLSGSMSFWSGIGEMMGGGYSAHPWPAGEAPRLGVPGVHFVDGPRGVVMKGATTFPVSMARGATWDSDLEERVGDAIGREVRACGANFFGGVCVNLLRHPAWGRAQETYGEDSFHIGVQAAALARGVQHHAMACVKHYACNSMENARFSVDVEADARALREVYLPHFKRVVDAGVASVMTSYNSVNGEWCGQNTVLIRDILKGEWGFGGFTLTDFIFGMRDAKTAILAGQDLEMPFRSLYARDLERLVESGEVPEALVDDAARRILRQEYRFAGKSGDYSPAVLGCEGHRNLAREAAEKSIVLLKNEGALLPLSGKERVAVIGHLADTPNTGDGGSSNTQPAYVVTPLAGLLEWPLAAGITYDDGSDPQRAAATAAQADIALVVAGYTHLDEGECISPGTGADIRKLFPTPGSVKEAAIAAKIALAFAGQAISGSGSAGFSPGGDRTRLTLRPEDEALIQAVAAANPRTIVAVMAGSSVIMENWRDRAAAILMLWYPGMEGGRALANILLGRANPSGRLPCTFPRRSADLPYFDRDAKSIRYDLWHGYRKLERDGANAAFPFGFGLSYTTFEHSGFEAALQDGIIRVAMTVHNAGSVAGEEVVQVYVRALDSLVERARRELKAYRRVALQPGASTTITLEIPVVELAYYDEDRGWVIEPGRYLLIAGRHAEDKGLEAIVVIPEGVR